ncbi:glycosyltransferase family 2 protein, partial [Escherichia coli]|nr:glycosyltransferase family 2 protein [Escherichia coli]EFJ8087235.1 glycosyltransferase family 2 protein [Escherichia coli]
MSTVTLVITSCGRFELLEKTISSLVNRYPFTEKIIIEDSGNVKVINKIKEKYDRDFTILINEKNIGQIKSIDKAYSLVTTEYIFHCEDDWHFYRDGFIEDSLDILKEYRQISMVSLRDWLNDVSINCHMEKTTLLQTRNGTRFFMLKPKNGDGWGGYSFNPGLRRLQDYKEIIGQFSKVGHEKNISLYFLEKGMNMALLESSAVEHIGWNHHILSKNNPQERFYLLKKFLPKEVI